MSVQTRSKRRSSLPPAARSSHRFRAFGIPPAAIFSRATSSIPAELSASVTSRTSGCIPRHGIPGHDGFDRGELGARLERAGFRQARFQTVCEVERRTARGARRYPLFLAIADVA